MFKIAEKTTRSCSALSLVVAMTGIGTLRAQLPADSLALWLKADAGVVTSGPTVLEWQDQSGNNRHATASGNVQLVNNIINGHPAVQYFCNNGLLMTPSFQTFPDKRGAIFVVARTLGNSCVSGAGYGAFVQTYYGSGTTWQFGAFPEFYGFYDGVGSSNFNVAALPVNTWGIVTMNRTGNTTMDCYKSGIFSNTVSIADNQPSPNPLRIGASSLSWEVLNGYIAEVIIYNKAMTPAEVEQVNTYLADKYYFNGDVPLPIADDVTICGPGSATLTASGGTAYRWYDSPAATTPVASTASFTTPVLSSTTTYYVACYNGQLVGQRVPVIVTVELPGTACDDGDICTTNDVLDLACTCVGTFEDSDGDTVCDANDGCPTDPDKTAAGQCGCGAPDTDTDADGVADCVDACPELPGLTNGDACDDGNPNTSGDVVTNCICAGALATDCEGNPNGPAQPGTPCDDDDACTINDLWDVNCNCAGTFEDTDGDTVCDANDGCPTDPDKIAAGVCGCGNPEPGTACDDGNAGTENDQIDANCQCVGTPLDVDCEGTPGGTALPGTACDDQNSETENDTWDNNCVCVGTPIWDCPDLQANIGDACDDGNANTEGDMVDANCECHGTQVYDCPDLQANIGDACDDGDNTTDNDVVDANCECHGTPEGPCSEDLLLAISLDGNPGEVTWTVWDDTENTVVESGGPYAAGQANTTVTEAFCVPVGCYHLEVSDSGNDGGSSYVLSDDSGRRIIDASMGSYSSTSEIGGPLAARSFCVPTWNNSVLANWCDRSAHDRQSPLYCNSQPGATGYTWWFFDPHGTYNRRVTTANPTIVPNSLYSFPIPNNLWLNMRIRPVMAGSNFGPACRIKMVPHGGQGGSRELLFDEATNVTMSLYPNPNRDGLVTVYMEGVDVSDATMIDIDVYDMVGKRVFAERTVAAEGIVNHRMDLGHDTGAGLYMVNVTIDGKRYTQRLVIQ